MVEFLEFASQSAMLPPISIPIHISQYDMMATKDLEQLILASEESILAIPVPEENKLASWGSNYKERPDHWITSRLPFYNFLERVESFRNFVYESYLNYQNELDNPIYKVYAHGWVNIIRTNEHIVPHNHAAAHVNAPEETSYVSGNFCVRADDTSTNYRNPYIHNDWKSIPNNPGDLVLFPSFIFHNTSVNKVEQPRLSIAFDIITEEVYNNLPDNFKKIFLELKNE